MEQRQTKCHSKWGISAGSVPATRTNAAEMGYDDIFSSTEVKTKGHTESRERRSEKRWDVEPIWIQMSFLPAFYMLRLAREGPFKPKT